MWAFLTFSCGQTRKHALEEECILPSWGPMEVVLRTPVQSWSCRVPAPGSPAALLVSSDCLSHPDREPDVALSHMSLFHSSGFYLFQAPFLLNSVFILSTFTASSHFHHLSSLSALIFLILSIPHLHLLTSKEQKPLNKTYKRTVSSDDLHFTWAPPLNKWKGISIPLATYEKMTVVLKCLTYIYLCRAAWCQAEDGELSKSLLNE